MSQVRKHQQVEELEGFIQGHQEHTIKLEQVLRLVENNQVWLYLFSHQIEAPATRKVSIVVHGSSWHSCQTRCDS